MQIPTSSEQGRDLKRPLAFPMSSLQPVADFHFSPGMSFRSITARAIRAMLGEIVGKKKKQEFCIERGKTSDISTDRDANGHFGELSPKQFCP